MIKENFSLKRYNTFGIDAICKRFVEFNSEEELVSLYSGGDFNGDTRLVLGGGSNVLFTKDFQGTIIHPCNKDISIIESDTETLLLKVGAGLDWDEFTGYCVENGYQGVENLSYIPGNVGASPVQNVGAYGVEAGQLIEQVDFFEFSTGNIVSLSQNDCAFGYRDSIFKNSLKDKGIVVNVYFRLYKTIKNINLSYSHLKASVEERGDITLKNIRNTIIEIRKSKLPETSELGSAGSFFKNPVVDKTKYEQLKNENEKLSAFQISENEYKLSAAWLIDNAGLKGASVNDAQTYKFQPLVIVNNGNASGNDILELKNKIQKEVFEKYGVELHPEVCVL